MYLCVSMYTYVLTWYRYYHHYKLCFCAEQSAGQSDDARDAIQIKAAAVPDVQEPVNEEVQHTSLTR